LDIAWGSLQTATGSRRPRSGCARELQGTGASRSDCGGMPRGPARGHARVGAWARSHGAVSWRGGGRAGTRGWVRWHGGRGGSGRGCSDSLVGVKVLVTGGAGFIGSNFVLRAREVRPDWRITVLDAMTYAANLTSLDPVADQVEVVKGSVADPDLVDEL